MIQEFDSNLGGHQPYPAASAASAARSLASGGSLRATDSELEDTGVTASPPHAVAVNSGSSGLLHHTHTQSNTGSARVGDGAPGPLSYFSNDCPGFTGAGSRMHVEPLAFSPFFHRLAKRGVQIVIPLLQRTYCWTDDQIHRWWRDADGGAHSALFSPNAHGNHATGKCIFKTIKSKKLGSDACDAEFESLWCIDGQQRITTQLLLLASLRDAILLILSSQPPSQSQSPNCLRVELEQLCGDIESYLFLDVSAMLDWVQHWATTAYEAINASQSGVSANNGVRIATLMLQEGAELPFTGGARLLPSYVDRAPFFELLLFARCQHALQAITGSNNAIVCVCSSVTNISRQAAAKILFDRYINTALLNAANQPDSASESLKCSSNYSSSTDINSPHHIAFMTAFKIKRGLDRMSMMFCEVLSEVNLAHVFLWLQEKSIFSMGALLTSPSPGVKFAGSDFIRNFLLHSFMDLAMDQQEAIYRDHWLAQIELPIRHSEQASAEASLNGLDRYYALDRFLAAFLGHHYGCSSENICEIGDYSYPLANKNIETGLAHRRIGTMEQSFITMISSQLCQKAISVTGMSLKQLTLYARFQSYAEEMELSIIKAGHDSFDGKHDVGVRISKQTCLNIIAKLAEFREHMYTTTA